MSKLCVRASVVQYGFSVSHSNQIQNPYSLQTVDWTHKLKRKENVDLLDSFSSGPSTSPWIRGSLNTSLSPPPTHKHTHMHSYIDEHIMLTYKYFLDTLTINITRTISSIWQHGSGVSVC